MTYSLLFSSSPSLIHFNIGAKFGNKELARQRRGVRIFHIEEATNAEASLNSKGRLVWGFASIGWNFKDCFWKYMGSYSWSLGVWRMLEARCVWALYSIVELYMWHRIWYTFYRDNYGGGKMNVEDVLSCDSTETKIPLMKVLH